MAGFTTIRGAGMLYDPQALQSMQSGITAPSQIGTWNELTLAAGGIYFPPAGAYNIQTGGYSWVEFKDPITGLWKSPQQTANVRQTVFTDGQNMRVCNITGCAVGAFVTTVGSGYTNSAVGSNGAISTALSPIISVGGGAGGSTWAAIVGGAVSGTVTITTAGATYNYPPTLIVANPPPGGVQCTMTCTVSAGAINAVTVVNQGAGYQTAPSVVIVPDPRDITAPATNVATPGVLTTALTGSGTVTAVLPTNHGTPVTAIPTLTFSSGSAAATVVMAWTVTGFSVGTAGAVYGNAQPFLVIAAGGIVPGSASPGAVVNPALGPNLFVPRTGFITGTSTSGGAVTATGLVIQDGGLFQAVPNGFVIASGTAALPTTTAIVTLTVGGVSDTVLIQQI